VVDEDEEGGPGGSRSPPGPAPEAEPAAPPPPPGAPVDAVAGELEEDDAVGLAEPRGSDGS
jgi:hypothetical protein